MNGDTNTACLFYDGACPLCRAEVNRLAELSGSALQLQDIHDIEDGKGLPPRRELLEKLHYRDGSGKMISGLSANVAAWQHTRFGGLWRVLEWPLIRPLATRLYDAWARWRYRRLYTEE